MTYEPHLMRLQRSAAGLCIAVLLVAGLISVPTSCDCGAGVPHGHSLFILAGHHHDPDGAVFDGPDTRQDQHDHGHHQESPSAGPQLMGRIMHSADRVAVAIPLFETASTSWQRVSYLAYSDVISGGEVVTPEAPPPQAVLPV